MRKICLLWNYIRLRSTKIFQGCLASCSQPRVDNSSQNDPEDTDDPARCELPSLLGRISPIAPMNYYESDPLPGIQFSHASTTWNIYIYMIIYRITLHHANKSLLLILSYILKMDHSIIPEWKHLWRVCEKDTYWEIARMATGCIYHKLSCKMMYSSESTRDSSDVS